MAIQRLGRCMPFILRRPAVRRFIPALPLLLLIVMGLPGISGAQQDCPPDGDVNGDGNLTAQDALLAFQQALSLVELDMCQLSRADVSPMPSAPDGDVTARDALCIFQKALALPSCLDAPANQPPAAVAGADQSVDTGTQVTLSGSASSDPDGTIARYGWEQTAGTMVTLNGADSATATFTAPDMEGTLTFLLTVTDDDEATGSDEVNVTVQPPPGNQPPSVNAGPNQTVEMGSVVMLLGSGLDPDGQIASYQWAQTGGAPVMLSVTDQALSSFHAPEVDSETTLTFRLTVADDGGEEAQGEVRITIRGPQPFVLDMSQLDDPRYRLQ